MSTSERSGLSQQAFSKLEALGNDFMLIDARRHHVRLQADDIRRLADRRRGVGFDQLLILKPATDVEADLKVEIFNADGGEAEQCGNGLRAIALWLDLSDQLNTGHSDTGCHIQTPAGLSTLRRVHDDHEHQYSATLPGLTFSDLAQSLPLPEPALSAQAVILGNPHLVLQWPHPPTAEELSDAVADIESDPDWVNRCNIGLAFVQPRPDPNTPMRIHLRVHERGAGPTPACGSGACAAAVTAMRSSSLDLSAIVHQPGGTVMVNWLMDRNSVSLTGPVRAIYEGSMA